MSITVGGGIGGIGGGGGGCGDDDPGSIILLDVGMNASFYNVVL